MDISDKTDSTNESHGLIKKVKHAYRSIPPLSKGVTMGFLALIGIYGLNEWKQYQTNKKLQHLVWEIRRYCENNGGCSIVTEEKIYSLEHPSDPDATVYAGVAADVDLTDPADKKWRWIGIRTKRDGIIVDYKIRFEKSIEDCKTIDGEGWRRNCSQAEKSYARDKLETVALGR